MGMGSSLSLRDGRQFSLLILIEFKQTFIPHNNTQIPAVLEAKIQSLAPKLLLIQKKCMHLSVVFRGYKSKTLTGK